MSAIDGHTYRLRSIDAGCGVSSARSGVVAFARAHLIFLATDSYGNLAKPGFGLRAIGRIAETVLVSQFFFDLAIDRVERLLCRILVIGGASLIRDLTKSLLAAHVPRHRTTPPPSPAAHSAARKTAEPARSE